MALEGLREIEKRLNEEIAKIKGASLEGLLKAGLAIKQKAQQKCPVVTGNLMNSAFVTWSGGVITDIAKGFRDASKGSGEKALRSQERTDVISESNSRVAASQNPRVEIGFSAVYAIVVHENPRSGKTGGISPSGRVYPPGTFARKGEWKFLENAMKENTGSLLEIIANSARRK